MTTPERKLLALALSAALAAGAAGTAAASAGTFDAGGTAPTVLDGHGGDDDEGGCGEGSCGGDDGDDGDDDGDDGDDGGDEEES